MTEAAKEARRAYKRRWAKDHPESVRASQRKYWERKAAEATAAQPLENSNPDPKTE